MATAALVGLVALLAISFWRPLRRVRHALGGAYLVASGYAFLALGITVGYGFDIAHEPRLVADLGPIVAFAAGWVGFAAGSRFESHVLATVPARAFARALAPALTAAVAVGGVGALVLRELGAPTVQVAAGALCLAAAAASAGPTLAAVLRARRPGRSREGAATLRMIEFSAGVADGVVVLLALAAFALFPTAAEDESRLWLLALSVGGGVVLGGALWMFLAGDHDDDERLLLGLGMLAMIAGLGGWLRVSPAAVAAVAGVVLANLPGGRSQGLVRAIQRVERPAVVILMAVVGMYLAGDFTWQLGALVGAMFALRLAVKRVTGGPAVRVIEGAPNLAAPTGWSLGLAPQGILGLVVALSFFHVWHDEVGRTVLAAVAIGGLLNELVAPLLMLRLFRRLPSEPGRAR